MKRTDAELREMVRGFRRTPESFFYESASELLRLRSERRRLRKALKMVATICDSRDYNRALRLKDAAAEARFALKPATPRVRRKS